MCSPGEYTISDELPKSLFPHVTVTSSGAIKLKSTSDNFEALLNAYGISAHYDEILKAQQVNIPHCSYHNDLTDNASLLKIKSLCSLNGLTKDTSDYLGEVFAKNTVNPIRDWILSIPWDGKDRITEISESVKVTDDCTPLRDKVIPLWLIQCVAALDGAEKTPISNALPKFESVLVFQGEQGIKKTTWVSRLLPVEHRQYIQTGAHLEVGNRDSEKVILSHWIVEFGELDATFKKSDIAQLKAFLSKEVDDVRLPYDRCFNTYARRTSFIASVNEMEFLIDNTGNRRFWPLTVTQLDDISDIDMQQLWAQAWHLYINGEQWWPDEELEKQLLTATQKHEPIDIVTDILAQEFDLEDIDSQAGESRTSGEILSMLPGIPNTTQNSKKVASILKSRGFTVTRNSSGRRYRVKHRFDDLRNQASTQLKMTE